MIRWLAILACVLTVAVTAASAFIRHSQAGLDCAPWPQCYREAGAAPARAALDDTPLPVLAVRALHRVSAVGVGLLGLGLLLFGWSRFDASDRSAAMLALADIVGLSWLGRYTPHDLPLVTLGNVVGGFALAAAFGWLAAGPGSGAATGSIGGARGAATGARGAAPLAWLALGFLALVACGGVMISVRHAVDACGIVACAAGARFDATAFDPWSLAAGVETAAGRALHLAHRGAALAFVVVTLASATALHRRGERALAGALATLALLQVGAGLATALAGAPPLASAVAHNAGAALLAIALAGAARRASARAQS